MYELANQFRIKDLLGYNLDTFRLDEYVLIAHNAGVDVGELVANLYVYEYNDDIIFTVEYIKAVCGLIGVFRNLYDTYIYVLRTQGYLDSRIYSILNFHGIFSVINDAFNKIFMEQCLFEEIGIYSSEVSLETSIYLYRVFNDTISLCLKDFMDPNTTKFIFNKHNMRNIQKIYGDISNYIENVFYII